MKRCESKRAVQRQNIRLSAQPAFFHLYRIYSDLVCSGNHGSLRQAKCLAVDSPSFINGDREHLCTDGTVQALPRSLHHAVHGRDLREMGRQACRSFFHLLFVLLYFQHRKRTRAISEQRSPDEYAFARIDHIAAVTVRPRRTGRD